MIPVSKANLDLSELKSEMKKEFDSIWMTMTASRQDLESIGATSDKWERLDAGLSAVIHAQTEQGVAISKWTDTMNGWDKILDTLKLETSKAVNGVAQLESKVKSGGSQEGFVELARRVEFLDASERSKTIIVFGWPINSTGEAPDTMSFPEVVAIDAQQFLDTIGVTEVHAVGPYKYGRRGSNAVPALDGLPPPMFLTFKDSFAAQMVFQQYLNYKRRPHNSNASFRAKIDVTIHERNLQRATQRMVDELRAKGMDARYRQGGRIARYTTGNIFGGFVKRSDWPTTTVSTSAPGTTTASSMDLDDQQQVAAGASNAGGTFRFGGTGCAQNIGRASKTIGRLNPLDTTQRRESRRL